MSGSRESNRLCRRPLKGGTIFPAGPVQDVNASSPSYADTCACLADGCKLRRETRRIRAITLSCSRPGLNPAHPVAPRGRCNPSPHGLAGDSFNHGGATGASKDAPRGPMPRMRQREMVPAGRSTVLLQRPSDRGALSTRAERACPCIDPSPRASSSLMSARTKTLAGSEP